MLSAAFGASYELGHFVSLASLIIPYDRPRYMREIYGLCKGKKIYLNMKKYLF